MADVAVHLVAPLRAVKHHEPHAHVVWIDHKNGKSSRLRSGGGAFSAIPVSLADNADATDRATTPGELLAAAHTTSFIATLAELLTRGGTPARELEAHATCEIEAAEGGRRITAAHLRVCGRDTQLDAASFSAVCQQALADCPISRALSPGIPITLNARVAGANQSPSRTRVRTPVPSTIGTERVQASSRTASRAGPLRCAELGIASIDHPARPSSRDASGRSVSPTQGSARLALVGRQAEPRIMIPSREVQTVRIDYRSVFPQAVHAMSGLEAAVHESSLEPRLLELVKMRVSQLNGCAYCLDMHSKDARATGEREQRLYLLSAWREAPCYSDRERAALAWCEALTLIATTDASNTGLDDLALQFDEEEIVALTLAIVAINGWNRFAIGLRSPVGHYTSPHGPEHATARGPQASVDGD